jgi:hypothetical protein
MGGDPTYKRQMPQDLNMRLATHIEHRKLGQDGVELLFKRILCKLDLSHIKVSYSTDFEVFVNDLGV